MKQSRLPAAFLLALTAPLSVPGLLAQTSAPPAFPPPDPPVPHAQQLREALQKLTTTGRMMYVVAHPDDEDGPLLTLEARGKGREVMLFTFTHGEGGQDATGAIFGDELGLLRVLELLQADKSYGVGQRFSRVADFGFSKTPEETFAKWGGKDVPLGDLVRQIRLFQPDVIVAGFSGTPRDGHGHHQASSILAQEAFTAAADPKRFPEQHLPPWQAKKLYIQNIPDDQVTLTIDTGAVNPVLGESPTALSLQGLRHQASQGLANIQVAYRHGTAKLKLVETAPGFERAPHETGLFDGIKTSDAAASMPRVQQAMAAIRDVAEHNSGNDLATRVGYAMRTAQVAAVDMNMHCRVVAQAEKPQCLRAAGDLSEKQQQLNHVAALLSGAVLQASTTASPLVAAGDTFAVRLDLSQPASAQPLAITDCKVFQVGQRYSVPCSAGGKLQQEIRFTAQPGEPVHAEFHRADPARDTQYALDNSTSLDVPLPSPSFYAVVTLNAGSGPFTLSTPLRSSQAGSLIYLAPALTLETEPKTFLRSTPDASESQLTIAAQSHSSAPHSAEATLHAPTGWTLTPQSSILSLAPQSGDRSEFLIMPTPQHADAHDTIPAQAKAGGTTYTQGVHLITRPDLEAFPFYFPAQTIMGFVRAEFPPKLNVGYIMGAGDDIPDALRSLGVNVTLLTPDALAHADLSKYSTIATGIRAYATRADLRDNNARLLEYVKNGGTMVVQYEQDWRGFNAGHYAPYPLELANVRADQEELPVTLLHPDDPLFHAPNTVTDMDFRGWIQEYGLYFADKWAPEYEPLLSMHDANETAHDGALLRAHYGKGTWIYSGLAMFRQVPNGVPGATRLFLNMLSAGHTASEAPVVSAQAANQP